MNISSSPNQYDNRSIVIWFLFLLLAIPYQAKSQDNKWMLYELDDNVSYNNISADIELDGYSIWGYKDKDTIIVYRKHTINEESSITIVFSPQTKIVSSLSYEYQYIREGMFWDTYLNNCRLYFSDIFNSYKKKYGNPTEILIAEDPRHKGNMKKVQIDMGEINNISGIISEMCYFEIYWKNVNRNVRLSFYKKESDSNAEIEKYYLNCHNDSIKNEEIASNNKYTNIIKWGGLISFFCAAIFLAIFFVKRKNKADEDNYQLILEQIEAEKEAKEREQESRRQKELMREQLLNEYNNYISCLKAKYGDCDKSIRLHSKKPEEISEILVFTQSKHVVISKKEYSFSDILDCTINDDIKEKETVQTFRSDSSATSKTKTGSMIGRAIAGGVLLGGVGAVIGGSTAKRNTIIEHGTDTSIHNKEIEHNYTVAITVKDISNPVISINVGNDTRLKDQIVSLMKVIISMK